VASLTKHRSGWNIRYVNQDGKRVSFYPGVMPKRDADAIKRHLERLLASMKSRTALPDETAFWLAGCGDVMRQKLYSHDLISKPNGESPAITLQAFTENYIQNKSDVKPATKTVWNRCQRLLANYFTAARPIDSITLGDAKDFRQWMLREGSRKTTGESLKENTVRKMCSVASQFFADAVDRGLISKNPFSHKDIPRTVREHRSRDFFITREMAEKVLTACPDAEWRLLFALSRFGGLRCPSEHLSLQWKHMDWSSGRMTVVSPKTEHHEGKEQRLIPLFPELLPYLREAHEKASDKTGNVITRYRSTEANLRTQFRRIIEKAGLTPWPKIFHNLRASRETELAGEYPIQVVCAWIGNSPTIAAKHYLTVTDADFQKASNVRQNALQNMTEPGRMDTNTDEQVEKKPRRKRGESSISRRKEGKESGHDRTRTCDILCVRHGLDQGAASLSPHDFRSLSEIEIVSTHFATTYTIPHDFCGLAVGSGRSAGSAR